jgi:hypothetical protein
MTAPRSDLTSRPSTGQLRWERISEAEARAAIGDDALDAALAEVGAKGRASAERYRAAGHSIADQAWHSRMALNWRALRVTGEARWAIYDEAFPADLADALRPLPPDVSAAFDQEAALAVLVTFATHWDDLRPDGPGRTDFTGVRRHPSARVEAILVFYAIEVAPGQIVITNVVGHPVDR